MSTTALGCRVRLAEPDALRPQHPRQKRAERLRPRRGVEKGTSWTSERIHRLGDCERSAYDAALARGLAVDGWAPFSTDDLKRLRELDRVGYGFLYPGVDPQISRRALACAPSPCGALVEAAWAHVTIGEFASRDTSEAFWSLPFGDCSPDLLRQLRAVESSSAETAKALLGDGSPLERLRSQGWDH